jgi:hypothetical protein
VPYDRVKFYYKLKKHELFFDFFGISFEKVQELMSRDFILHFKNRELAADSFKKIKIMKDNFNLNLFGDIEIKENKLFVSLIYNQEIKNQFIKIKEKKILLNDFVSFVAIKNGMHSGKGFFYTNNKFQTFKQNEKIKLNKIKDYIFEFFKKSEN